MPQVETRMPTERFKSSAVSPIAGVPYRAWQAFETVMEIQPLGAISPSGGLGAYDMRPRRMVEIGYAVGLEPARTPAGRQIQRCVFARRDAESPAKDQWTEERFLADLLAQSAAFRKSNRLYYAEISSGRLEQPVGLSLAATLVVLHRGGRGALGREIFTDTQKLIDVVKGLF